MHSVLPGFGVRNVSGWTFEVQGYISRNPLVVMLVSIHNTRTWSFEVQGYRCRSTLLGLSGLRGTDAEGEGKGREEEEAVVHILLCPALDLSLDFGCES